MKRLTKIVGIFMLVFVLAFANTAFARGNVCACGKGSYYRVSTSYTAWSTTNKTRACTHNKVYGLDYQQKRRKTENFKCNACGNTYSADSYEYRWECRGIS